ncbi:arylesterase [Marinobacter bohaiensis]|uniref:arylesterase n=1 Tax=Marinobacter bohaiensis TaxID=2201898 RepID=UPI002AF6CA04|nr:arylesterase [Marinobacter bohaiensis]
MFLRSITFYLLTLCSLFTIAVPAGASTLLIMGDSLSASYGVDTEKAWVSLLRQRLDREGFSQWTVANASISGETTDGGLRRLPGLLEQHEPEVVIIELGGNDGLRGFPPNVTQENLARMTELSQAAGARVLLVGMQMPPNYGERYTRAFAAIYPTIAENSGAELVPFFLDGIYNRDGFMQDDGIHPTAAGQPQLLDNVWPHLHPMLQNTTGAN